MDKKGKIMYWQEISDIDISVMASLFETKNYHYALYIGHLAIEKILKAHYVNANNANPPKSHDLLKIAHHSNLQLDEIKEKFLLLLNNFNIEARYPDEKLNFYKTCTKEYTEPKIEQIEELQKWLKSLLK